MEKLICVEKAIEIFKNVEIYNSNDDFRRGMMEGLNKVAPAILENIPNDFDKEKVIQELENYLFEWHCVEGDEEIKNIINKGGV